MSRDSLPEKSGNPYEQVKSELFRAVYEKHGFTGWTRYWAGLQSYVLAHSSLEELKEIVDLYVTESNIHLHNNLIIAILSNTNASLQSKGEDLENKC